MTCEEEEELIKVQKSLLNASMEKLRKGTTLCGGIQPHMAIVSAAVADVAVLTTTTSPSSLTTKPETEIDASHVPRNNAAASSSSS